MRNTLKKEKVNKIEFIKNKCKGKSVLDLGCVRHDADYSIGDPNWLHRHLHEVSKSIVGVDYLEHEVSKLNQLSGFTIIVADVTKPLPISEKFDVIVAGDIIEHLTNFEGFFENITRLLKPDGCLIISTGNPYYRDGFFFALLKGEAFINPEHTCWIDQKCLSQLVQRFSLEVTESYWIKDSQWALRAYISATEDNYDLFTNRWKGSSRISILKRKLLAFVCEFLYAPLKLFINTDIVRYADYVSIVQLCEK